MITRTKQVWTVGSKVNVGFFRGLEVIEVVLTPGNYRPDEYRLRDDKGRTYVFTPHHGLVRE